MSLINQRKKEHVRGVIFRKKSISRKELLAMTGYNWRSIVTYTEELRKQGLINITPADSAKRGRPTVLFHSNSENVFFIGVTLVQDQVFFLAMGINANIIHARQFALEEGKSHFDTASGILQQIDSICQEHQEMALVGIGFNRCLYFLDSRRLSAFSELVSIAGRKYRVPVKYADNDSIFLRHLYRMNNLSGRAVGVIVGEELRMAEIDNGGIAEEIRGYAAKLRHWRIAPESQEKCYCGKKGCLDCMLRYEARTRRYCRAVGIPGGSDTINVRELYTLAEDGNPAAREILRFDALLIARLFHKIQNDLRFDHLFFYDNNRLLYQETARQHAILSGGKGPPIQFCSFTISDGIVEIADMIRRYVLDAQKITKEG